MTAVCRAANRISLSDAPRRSGAAHPSRAARTNAASSTLRPNGPTVSNRAHSGTTPFSDTRPEVVFSPTRSFHALGMRTDPPVSLPIPLAARPKATLAAAPDEDPPGTAASSFTQGGVAVIGFSPSPEKASSLICVLPRQTSPAIAALRRTSQSRAGTRPSSSFEPASVATPALSKRSFQLTGTPSRGPRRCPARARVPAAAASERARRSVTAQ